MRKSVFSHADKAIAIYGVPVFPHKSGEWTRAFGHLLRAHPEMHGIMWEHVDCVAVVRGAFVFEACAIRCFEGVVKNVFSPLGILFSDIAWAPCLSGYTPRVGHFLTQEDRVRHALGLLRGRQIAQLVLQEQAQTLVGDARRFLRLLLDSSNDMSQQYLFSRWAEAFDVCRVRELMEHDGEFAAAMAASTVDLLPYSGNRS